MYWLDYSEHLMMAELRQIWLTIRDWYHKSIPSKTNIVGLGNHDLAVTNRINVKLLPWGTDGITVDTTFWILPKRNKWSPIYPTGDIPPLAIKGKLEAPLADPFFWKSAPVHLLLGIETLAAIAKENAPMQRVSDNLVTQPNWWPNVMAELVIKLMLKVQPLRWIIGSFKLSR